MANTTKIFSIVALAGGLIFMGCATETPSRAQGRAEHSNTKKSKKKKTDVEQADASFENEVGSSDTDGDEDGEARNEESSADQVFMEERIPAADKMRNLILSGEPVLMTVDEAFGSWQPGEYVLSYDASARELTVADIDEAAEPQTFPSNEVEDGRLDLGDWDLDLMTDGKNACLGQDKQCRAAIQAKPETLEPSRELQTTIDTLATAKPLLVTFDISSDGFEQGSTLVVNYHPESEQSTIASLGQVNPQPSASPRFAKHHLFLAGRGFKFFEDGSGPCLAKFGSKTCVAHFKGAPSKPSCNQFVHNQRCGTGACQIGWTWVFIEAAPAAALATEPTVVNHIKAGGQFINACSWPAQSCMLNGHVLQMRIPGGRPGSSDCPVGGQSWFNG